MNLAQAFAASAQSHARKPALFWGEQEHTFEFLLARTHFVASLLHQRYGVQPGERVGLWLKNCPEFVAALFGVLELGAVVVPINNFLKPEEVNHI